MELRIDISRPDALALLALLETSNTFPDVVEELRAVLDLRVDGRAAVAGEERAAHEPPAEPKPARMDTCGGVADTCEGCPDCQEP